VVVVVVVMHIIDRMRRIGRVEVIDEVGVRIDYT